jgi:hypothetical protein
VHPERPRPPSQPHPPSKTYVRSQTLTDPRTVRNPVRRTLTTGWGTSRTEFVSPAILSGHRHRKTPSVSSPHAERRGQIRRPPVPGSPRPFRSRPRGWLDGDAVAGRGPVDAAAAGARPPAWHGRCRGHAARVEVAVQRGSWSWPRSPGRSCPRKSGVVNDMRSALPRHHTQPHAAVRPGLEL